MHFMRKLLAHAGKQGERVVSAFIATAFAQDDADSARAQWRLDADQLNISRKARLSRPPKGETPDRKVLDTGEVLIRTDLPPS